MMGGRAAALTGAMLIASIPGFAQAPASGQTGTAERAAERIRALQREADRLAAESRTLLGDLRKLELERQIHVERLTAAEAELQTVAAELQAARRRVVELEARRQQTTPALAAELVEIYKRGRRRHAQVLLASLADSRALGRLIRGAQALAGLEGARLEAHRRAIGAEQAAVRKLERQVETAGRVRDAHAAARVALDESAAERNRLIDAIDRDRDVAARYAGELQAARADLERRLASLSPPSVAALPIAPFKGDLDWPVRGVVRSHFAGAPQPNHPRSAIVRHGIELAATERSAVTAIHGGQVSYVGPTIDVLKAEVLDPRSRRLAPPEAGPGNTVPSEAQPHYTGSPVSRGASLEFGMLVVVEHAGGVQSLYGYVADVVVRVGSVLDRGDLIGHVGLPEMGGRADSSLAAGGAALYFELRVDGRPVDPLQWLRSSP